jgi:hypothetical protein
MSTTSPQYKFDPRVYEDTIKVRGANDKDYLSVKWRIVWLRSDDWNAQIETEKVLLDDKMAVFVARITTTRGGVSVAHGSETKGDFADYVEKAESKAIGRALANLGYSEEWKTFVIDQKTALRNAKREEAAVASAPVPAPAPAPAPAPVAHTAPAPVAPPAPAPVAPAAAAKAATKRTATAAPRLAPPADAPTPIRPREADDRKAFGGEWGGFSVGDFAYVKETGMIGADAAQQLRDHLHQQGYSALAALARIHKVEAEAAAEGLIAPEQATQPYTLDELRPSLGKQLLLYTTNRPAATVAA